MSIATLKRKTQQTFRVVSTGRHQFSLNGTHRSQGYVGQTSLSRSLPSTSMRGTVARGYGGCCGAYREAPIVASAVLSLNDATVVKASVGTAEKRLSLATRPARRPAPFSATKPSDSNNTTTQAARVDALVKKTLTCVEKLDAASYANGVYIGKPAVASSCKIPGFARNSYGWRSRAAARCAALDLKKATHDGSQGAYLAALDSACAANDAVQTRTIGGFAAV